MFSPAPARVTVDIRYGKNIDFLYAIAEKEAATGVVPEAEINECVKEYRAAWGGVEQAILSAMERSVGISFPDGTIKVYLVTRPGTPTSDPLSIPLDLVPTERKFIAKLTHELYHSLIFERYKGTSCFPEGSDYVRACVHTLIFAGMTEVFSEAVPNAELLAEEEEDGEGFYADSWSIIHERGSKTILADFRDCIRNNAASAVAP